MILEFCESNIMTEDLQCFPISTFLYALYVHYELRYEIQTQFLVRMGANNNPKATSRELEIFLSGMYTKLWPVLLSNEKDVNSIHSFRCPL